VKRIIPVVVLVEVEDVEPIHKFDDDDDRQAFAVQFVSTAIRGCMDAAVEHMTERGIAMVTIGDIPPMDQLVSFAIPRVTVDGPIREHFRYGTTGNENRFEIKGYGTQFEGLVKEVRKKYGDWSVE